MSSAPPQTIRMQPAGCPGWITPALVRETIDVWSPYYPTPLTEDDAVEILQTVGMLSDVMERKAA